MQKAQLATICGRERLKLGFYLNSSKPVTLYHNETKKPYFVDKTPMLRELFPLVETGTQYLCVTRPRRFGKTIMANMIGSFFGKNDRGAMFDTLAIAGDPGYAKHRNGHNVIYITLSELPDGEVTYATYISRVKAKLLKDLIKAYPDSDIGAEDAVWDALRMINEEYDREQFIFVLDEWDYIFHRDFANDKEKKAYISFLSNLLKDQPYVELAYMTGILPIAKYSSGSELNMFREYTMASSHKFGTYFGFTEQEVNMLHERYRKITAIPGITREGLRAWYDGYHALSRVDTAYQNAHPEAKIVTMEDGSYEVVQIYNPRSVVCALSDNQLADYWTSSGPYDEIFYFVKNDVAGVRDDIAKMIAGESVAAQVREYSSVNTEISSRDEVLSAMIVYGFLTAVDGQVSIPNKELMDKFVDMVRKENSLGYVYNLAKESERMLAATKAGDTATMEAILQQAHDTETGMLGYNNEAELSAIVKLVYLSARDDYDMEREDKSGVGYVDYLFTPKRNPADDCIIVELKVDAAAEDAIQQIKFRNYAQRFLGKLGEQSRYTGRILAVGISYFRNDSAKKHECRVEVLREKI